MVGRRALAAVAAVGLVVGAGVFLSRADAPAPAPMAAPSPTTTHELFVVPGANGDCSPADPCGSLDAALVAAAPGDTVRLAGGDYGEQLLKAGSGHDGEQVRFVGDPTDRPRLKRLLLEAHNLELVGIAISNDVRVRPSATDVTLTDLAVVGTVDIEADRTVLRDSRIVNHPDRDGVSVRSNAAGVQVLGNVIGPGPRTPGSPHHVDCLQVSAATDLLIEGNTMFRCAGQTVLIKADRGPIHRVTIRDNVLQGCLTRTPECDGFKSLQIRTAQEMSEIVVERNSIDGAVVFDALPGLVIERNLMTGDAGCSDGARNNVVAKSGCPERNRVVDVRFPGRDDEVPDLSPAATCDCAGYGARP